MGLPWNRIFHELNLTPLINKMNELAQTVEQLASQIVTVNNPRITIKQGGETKGSFTLNQSSAKTINLDAGGGGNTNTFSGDYNDLTNKPTIPTVNNATLTIKQGGTTKGTFTANASTDVEIDLDAGGGGGSTYTAGTGIDITNNVISVTNPVNKVYLESPRITVPCLYNDNGTFYNLDGTTATLSNCLDLGTFSGDFGGFLYIRYILHVFSATFQDYDFDAQSHTQNTFSDIDKDTGYHTVYIDDNDWFDTYMSNNVIISNGTKNDVFPFILGKKNSHLYLFIASNCYGGISNTEYAESMEASFTIQFLGF